MVDDEHNSDLVGFILLTFLNFFLGWGGLLILNAIKQRGCSLASTLSTKLLSCSTTELKRVELMSSFRSR